MFRASISRPSFEAGAQSRGFHAVLFIAEHGVLPLVAQNYLSVALSSALNCLSFEACNGLVVF